MACTPGDLLNLAKCFNCLEPKQLEAIKSYLLCQVSTNQAITNTAYVCNFLFSTGDPISTTYSALTDDGNPSCSLTLGGSGTYLISGYVNFIQGSVVGGGTIRLAVNRTNHTPGFLADAAGQDYSVAAITSSGVLAITGPVNESCLSYIYTTANSGDILQFQAKLNSVLTSGVVIPDISSMTALKIS